MTPEGQDLAAVIAEVVELLRDELRAADAWQRGISEGCVQAAADRLALLLAEAQLAEDQKENADTRMDRLSTSSNASRTAATDVAEGDRSTTPNQGRNEP